MNVMAASDHQALSAFAESYDGILDDLSAKNVMAASDHQALSAFAESYDGIFDDLSAFAESYDGIFGELRDLPLGSTDDTLTAFAESHGVGFDFHELSSAGAGSVGFDELSSAVDTLAAFPESHGVGFDFNELSSAGAGSLGLDEFDFNELSSARAGSLGFDEFDFNELISSAGAGSLGFHELSSAVGNRENNDTRSEEGSAVGSLGFHELSSAVEGTRSQERSAVGSVGFHELSSAVESRENSDTPSEEGAIEQKSLVRKRRGRPPGSKNKPKPLPPPNVPTFVMPNSVQPFTIEIPSGCEVLERVMNLASGNYGVCILKVTGTVRDLTLAIPDPIHYPGCFWLLSLSGTILPPPAIPNNVVITFASEPGKAMGGNVLWPLFACSPVVIHAVLSPTRTIEQTLPGSFF